MKKPIFDYDDGDFIFSRSGNIAFNSDGDMIMRISDNTAMNTDSDEIHFTSAWTDDE